MIRRWLIDVNKQEQFIKDTDTQTECTQWWNKLEVEVKVVRLCWNVIHLVDTAELWISIFSGASPGPLISNTSSPDWIALTQLWDSPSLRLWLRPFLSNPFTDKTSILEGQRKQNCDLILNLGLRHITCDEQLNVFFSHNTSLLFNKVTRERVLKNYNGTKNITGGSSG